VALDSWLRPKEKIHRQQAQKMLAFSRQYILIKVWKISKKTPEGTYKNKKGHPLSGMSFNFFFS